MTLRASKTRTNAWTRGARLFIPLAGAAFLLALILVSAWSASAPAGAWSDPPRDPEIGAITLTSAIVYDPAPGTLTRTGYFNNKSAGTITVTVTVTGTPTLTLTGSAAFSNTTETVITSVSAPFNGVITYQVGTHHDTQQVWFTATNTNSLHVSIPITFVRDITAPAAGISHPAAGWVAVTPTLYVTGTAEDAGAGIERVRVVTDANGLAHTATYSPPAQTWGYTWTMSSEDGVAHRLLITVTDFVGNVFTATRAITVDNVAPGGTIIFTADLPVNLWVNTPTLHVQWAGFSDGGIITNYQYLISNTLPASLPSADGTFATTTQATATLNDGQWYFYVAAQDAAGNWSTTHYTGLFKVDTASPVVSIATPTPGAILTTTHLPNLYITGTASSDGSGLAQAQVTTGTTWVTAVGTHTWSYTWPLPISDRQVYTLTARATDNAANVGVSSNVIVTVDTQTPSNPALVTTTNSTPVDVWIDTHTIPVSWTVVNDNSGVTYYYTWTTISSTVVGASHLFTTAQTVTGTNLAEGSQWFHLRARDGVGNWATGTAHLGPFHIDLTPPTSTISAPASGAVLTMTAGASYTVSGAAGDTGGSALKVVTVTVNGGRLCAPNAAWWSCAWDIAGMDHVTFTLRSRAQDNAGNLQAAPHTVNVIVDTVTPVAGAPVAVGAPWTPGSTLVFTWNIPADNAGIRGYELLITDTTAGISQVHLISAPATQYISTTAAEGHTYVAKLRATDTNGNTGAWSGLSAAITPDLTDPLVHYGAPPIPIATDHVYVVGASFYYTSSNLNSVTLQVTATDNLSLTQPTASPAPSGWYGPIQVPMPPPTWRFLYGQSDVNLNPSGCLTVTGRDATGRTAWRTFTYTFDNELPAATVINAPAYFSATTGSIAVTYMATDTLSGVKQVQVYYRKNNGDWTAGPLKTYSAYAQTVSDTLGVAIAHLAGDGRYEWRAVAMDNVDNRHGAPAGNGDRVTLYDTTAPTTTANAPGVTGDTPIKVDWTASDATAGVRSATLWVNPLGAGWIGTVYSDTSGNSSGTFAYMPMAGDGVYYFYILATDQAGNMMPAPTTIISAQAQTTFGAAPPDTEAGVPGSYANYTPITVTWRATSTAASLQAVTLCVSTTLAGWQATSYVYTGPMTKTASSEFLYAPGGDGRYNFAIAAETEAGKKRVCPTSGPGSASILYDTHITAPVALAVAPADWTRVNSFTVTWVNPPDLSGIKGAYYSIGAPPTSNYDGTPAPTTGFNVQAPHSGRHPVYVWLEDKAGNVSYLLSRTVSLLFDDVLPSTPIITVPARSASQTFAVSWSAQDSLAGVVTYTLEYSSSKQTGWQLAVSGLITNTQLTVPFTDTIYTLRVTTYDAAGNSAQATKTIYVGPFRIFLPVTLRDYPPRWQVGDGMSANTKVYGLAACTGIFSKTVYAGTSDHGIYKSTDAGRNWSQPSSSLNTQFVDHIAAATNCNTVYATTFGQGVYKSIDGGINWTATNLGLAPSALYVYRIALDPSNNNTIYIGTADGVYKSTDGGASWSQKLKNFYVFGVSVDPSQPQTVYAALYNNGVYSSTDGGATWRLAGLPGTTAYIVAVDPDNSDHLLAATVSGLQRSSNGGSSWTSVGHTTKALWVMADRYNDQFLAGYDGLGVQRSADGQSWTAFDIGLSGASRTVNAVETGALYLYAGTNDRAWRYPRLP